MTVREFTRHFGFTPVVTADPDRTVSGCYVGDLLSWVMGRAQPGNAWITIMTNVNTVAVGSLADVSVVVLAEGVHLDKAVLDCAEARGVNIVSSALPAFETAVLIHSAV
jgi:hypothetical protein